MAAQSTSYYYVCPHYCFQIPSRRGWPPPSPRHPGKPLRQLRASQAGPCPQRHSGRLALSKAGTRGRPTAASADGHHLGWQPWRAGSCWSGRAWQSLPHPPGMAPTHASGFSGCQRGAGRPGWAAGLGRRLPSLGPGSSRLLPKCRAPGSPALASPSHPPGSLLLWAIPAKGPLHWLCPL